MKKCNNKDCEKLIHNNRAFCSIECLELNKENEKYNKENEYLKNPKYCKFCNEIIIYSKKENNFCNSNCAASYNNNKRKGNYVYHLSEQGLKNIQSRNNLCVVKNLNDKIDFYLKNPKKCIVCNEIVTYENKRKKFCCDKCKNDYMNDNLENIKNKLSISLKKFFQTEKGFENKKNLSLINTGKNFSDESRKKLSISGKNRCKDINERIRLRDIGRKGGYGKKGYTNNGIYYQSTFEKNCFEFLEKNNILFEPHKSLPNSSKISDIYFLQFDLWIELDGINREKKKKYLGKDYDYWINKLTEYKNNNLNFIIFYNYKEFADFLSNLIEFNE